MLLTTTTPVTSWLLIGVLAMAALALVVIAIARLALRSIAREKEKQRQLELEHQKELLVSNVQVQERERERIAGELHDSLASQLAVARISLYDEARPKSDAIALVDAALKVARNLSHELYPPLLEEAGLEATLRDFVEPLGGQLNIHIRAVGHHPPALDAQLHLLRIVQECLQNSLKHAEAEQLFIGLHFGQRWAGLLVRDNGKGFNTNKHPKGFGLHNIETRVQVLGGNYRLRSAPGKGTSITVLLHHEQNDHPRTR